MLKNSFEQLSNSKSDTHSKLP